MSWKSFFFSNPYYYNYHCNYYYLLLCNLPAQLVLHVWSSKAMHVNIAMLQTHDKMSAHDLSQLYFWRLGSHFACALLLTVYTWKVILPGKKICTVPSCMTCKCTSPTGGAKCSPWLGVLLISQLVFVQWKEGSV